MNSVWSVLLDGFLSALVGGVVAAVVAVAVVRAQIRADDRREQRREDVRLAVALQRASVRYAFALTDGIREGSRDELDVAVLDLWSCASEASAARPNDVVFRVWIAKFQSDVISSSDAIWKRRATLTTSERDELIRSVNERAQAVASLLESGEAIVILPTKDDQAAEGDDSESPAATR